MGKKTKRETLSMVFGESLAHEVIHKWLKDGGYILPSGRRSGIARLIESSLMLTRAYQQGLVSIHATPSISDKDVSILAALGVNLHTQNNQYGIVDISRVKSAEKNTDEKLVSVIKENQAIKVDENLVAMNNAVQEWK
jgi:hypothetical protein